MKPPPFGPDAWAPLARGWAAYHAGDLEAELVVRHDDGEAEVMPVALFFRGRGDLRGADEAALRRVRGRVLDGGAGVGSLALLLQEDGIRVTALEVVPEGVRIMRERGVRDVRWGRLEEMPASREFDTVLLLMNGTALAGTLSGMPLLLSSLEGLLAPGGQVLLDSTDLTGGECLDGVPEADGRPVPEGRGVPAPFPEDGAEYPGEIHYQVEFRGNRGAPFPQLFLDPSTLERLAEGEGWRTEVVWVGEGGEYLACLTRDPSI